MTKKRKRPTPLMLLWSRQEQRRFVDAVERLIAAIGDLESMLVQPKERARKAAATRKARAAAQEAVQALNEANSNLPPPNPQGAPS